MRHIAFETSFYYSAFHDIANLSMIELRVIKYSKVQCFILSVVNRLLGTEAEATRRVIKLLLFKFEVAGENDVLN